MGNEPSSGVAELERELKVLAEEWTTPLVRECLFCFVRRMLDFGCHGLTWTRRYRSLRAPRATALESRLARRGGVCDHAIFMHVVEPHPTVMVLHPIPESDRGRDAPAGQRRQWPNPFPTCRGVRAGSTVMCGLWSW